MKRSLSDSQDASSKKRKTEGASQFYGFSDEETFRLNTLKAQNLELFCKRLQQKKEIERCTGQLQFHQDRTRKYQQRVSALEGSWQRMLQKLNFDSLSTVPASSGFVKKLQAHLTQPHEGRDATKKQFSTLAASLETKLLLFITSYEKDRVEWESLRGLIRSIAPADLASESVRSSEELNRLIGGQYDRILQVASFEQQIMAIKETSASIAPFLEEIKELKHEIEEERKKQEQFQVPIPEQKTTTKTISQSQEPQVEAPSGPVDLSLKFELSQIETEIDSWQHIFKHRKQTLEEMRAEKETLLQQARQLAEKYSQIEYPNQDVIKNSAPYRLLEKQIAVAEPEIASWRREAEAMAHLIQECHHEIKNDSDQRLRLDQSRNKTVQEKLELLEAKSKQLQKENGLMKEKLDQKQEQTNVVKMRGLTQKMTSLEENIIREKSESAKHQEELSQMRAVLYKLEAEQGHSHLVDQVSFIQQQIEQLQNHLDAKEKAHLESIKQHTALQTQERNLVLLTDRYKNKLPNEQAVMIQLLCQQKAAQQEYNDLLKKVEVLEHSLQQEEAGAATVPPPTESEKEQDEQLKATNQVLLRDIESMESVHKKLLEVIKHKQKETENIKAEIAAIEQEFLHIQSENSKRTRQLVECEETNLRLIGDKIRQNQVNVLLQKKSEILAERVSKTEAKTQAQEEVLKRATKKVASLEEHIGKCSAELQSYRAASDPQGAFTTGVTQYVEAVKLKLDETQREIETQKIQSSEPIARLEEEKAVTLRNAEELELLRKQLDHWIQNREGEELGQVQKQLNHYKKILNCSECPEKPKSHVITKCFHVFCKDCVQDNRKCPKCSIPYHPDRDVQTVYI